MAAFPLVQLVLVEVLSAAPGGRWPLKIARRIPICRLGALPSATLAGPSGGWVLCLGLW